jgi:hypothetical protein
MIDEISSALNSGSIPGLNRQEMIKLKRLPRKLQA